MPKAYWIAAYDSIDDPDKLKAYADTARPVLGEFGGRILARGGRSVAFEGNEKVRIVVVEFPDLESAEACYASDGYRRRRRSWKTAACATCSSSKARNNFS